MSTREPLVVAAIQPRLVLGAIEDNLARVEALFRDAHRERAPALIVLPEALSSPNVFHPRLRAVVRPADGAPFRLLTRLARELGVLIWGGFLARRGNHARGTVVLVEPYGRATCTTRTSRPPGSTTTTPAATTGAERAGTPAA